MKLTRLRLIGFKSFVEPTDFLIEPGLNGVVGPNGCGKSNLVEALRWVMGESSYKSMRASSMDEVIFSGTNNRPARNNAEVGISIDNAERSAPSAFNDSDAIDIARRIEREAGSTYRINGREVRARDVQILFADASTGARSPALVHQGRIGEIIQAKPEQRRRVLEEAAGVAGLHARRHEAELRLKAAETNLLRIEDRIAELDLRLVQFAADGERERKLAADAEAALARLAAEEDSIRKEARESAGRRSGVDAKVALADGELSAAEKIFSDLTTALADLTAQRNQFENAAREQGERIARIAGEIAAIERELATLKSANHAPLTAAVEGAQAALSEAEAAEVAAEAAHNNARVDLEAARAALSESEKRVQRLETEAKTLGQMLSLETRNLWPPVIDHVSVDKGYEKALGAALGDDLDAPVDASAPMHWSKVAIDASDPALPKGAEPLSRFVKAPAQLARRLAQIGVVDRETGAKLAAALKSGQRLVSREGDLWRWDGYVAAAHAPTGAARRLAQRSRFAEIDGELVAARAEVDGKRRALDSAQAAFDAASHTESETRARERDLNRQAARLSALAEARARLTTSRDEASAAKTEAERALAALAPAAKIESKLAAVRDDIAGKRAKLAEVHAEQQAIVREAELADKRLAALATDKSGWIERRDGAALQIATLDQRIAEAKRDRAELENAPQIFAGKRNAMIGEVAKAETERRACADRLQEAENALAEADRDARAALEAASAAREDLARAEERFEGSKRRLADIGREIHDMLEIEPSAVAELAGIKPGAELPELAEIEARWSGCAASASAWARSTCAPRKSCARSKLSTSRSPPSATTWW